MQTRDQIKDKYKWNLADLFSSDEAWEEQFNAAKEQIKKFSSFKGKLADKAVLKSFFDFNHKLSPILERLYVYAKMNRDQDNGNNKYVSMCDKAYSLLTLSQAETSFVDPELSALDNETLLLLSQDKDFENNSIYLKELVRAKEHTLSEGEEKILALSLDMASSFDTVFTMLDDVDMTFKPITLDDGSTLEMSHGAYGMYLQNSSRNVRKQAYESMYSAHINCINTLASLYSSSVKKDLFYARARKFSTVLDGELFGGNIPKSVYTQLISAVNDSLPALHDYVNTRKQLLNLNDMKMYDMYVPIVSKTEKKYSYEEAQELLKKALKPLGEEYIALLERAFSERWIDVYETKGKTSGAYSWGAYGVHPYMLLNYQGRLEDVFTLAHEAGHSMHTYFSDKNLPYEKAQYRIFVAEVASTVNEVLLLKYLLNQTTDKLEQAYLLNHFLEQERTTVFRQTMFAEFELLAHEQAENGESLTVEWLNATYAALNKKYYGDAVETDDFIATEWSRIPHFYNCYYVYQYATGFSSAVAIADKILTEGAPAVEKYLDFLSSGGSNYPVELLKIAGVDLSTNEPIKQNMLVFAENLQKFKEVVL